MKLFKIVNKNRILFFNQLINFKNKLKNLMQILVIHLKNLQNKKKSFMIFQKSF